MPVPVVKTATGRYLILDQPSPSDERAVVYCRVSSADQKPELERQAGRVVAAATARGLTVADVVSEVGSALDGQRPKLAKLLRDPRAAVIVVEHRDRLARFGVDHLVCALQASGRRLVVLDEAEVVDDPVPDMLDVLTCLCARRYGRRSAARKARAAIEAAEMTR